MRTPEQLEAVAVEAYGPYAAATVGEVDTLARVVRRLRRHLDRVAGCSACGRSVRFAQRVLARDRLGIDGGAARDALGRPMRPLAWIEQALTGAGGERAAVTPVELRALVAEWRRLSAALATVASRSLCARSRDFARRALVRESDSFGTAARAVAARPAVRPLASHTASATVRAVVGE